MNIEFFLEKYDYFLFDADGTLYSGGELLPGVFHMLSILHENKKQIMLVTNNALASLVEHAKRLANIGIEISPEEVITPAVVLMYLLKESKEFKPPGGKFHRILCLSVERFASQIRAGGIDVVGASPVYNIFSIY
jgi:ribonucleotide monophosphatase NagD (HAD superfamily)